MNNNQNQCDIVQDLLPLYYDHACSLASCQLVEQHLTDCPKCRNTYEQLANNTINTVIKQESKGVLARHAQKERNAAFKAGVVIAGILLLPIIITFIVSMANGGGLGVFLVVTASMMLVAALTVIPLISSQKRILKCILCSIAALLLIFFFVDAMNGGGEFLYWSIPTLFGLSVVFFPFIIRNITLPPVLSDKKALITMIWDTLWLYLTIFIVCYRSGMAGMKTGNIVAFVLMLGVWLIFLTIRYLPVNSFIKAGISTFLCSIWMIFSNDICTFLIEHKRQLTISHINFSNWSTDISFNANVYVIILIAGGYDKNLDYTPLAKPILEHVKQLILFGSTKDKILNAVTKEKTNENIEIYVLNTLEEVVNKAKEVSNKGDVVLFSPASASFDLFKNFADRGLQFKELVKKIPD